MRCFCASKPLLAMYGIDERGKLYIHVKIYKQKRIYGEIVATGGEVLIRCRDCFRFHRIRFVAPYKEARLQSTRLPAKVAKLLAGDELTEQENID